MHPLRLDGLREEEARGPRRGGAGGGAPGAPRAPVLGRPRVPVGRPHAQAGEGGAEGQARVRGPRGRRAAHLRRLLVVVPPGPVSGRLEHRPLQRRQGEPSGAAAHATPLSRLALNPSHPLTTPPGTPPPRSSRRNSIPWGRGSARSGPSPGSSSTGGTCSAACRRTGTARARRSGEPGRARRRAPRSLARGTKLQRRRARPDGLLVAPPAASVAGRSAGRWTRCTWATTCTTPRCCGPRRAEGRAAAGQEEETTALASTGRGGQSRTPAAVAAVAPPLNSEGSGPHRGPSRPRGRKP